MAAALRAHVGVRSLERAASWRKGQANPCSVAQSGAAERNGGFRMPETDGESSITHEELQRWILLSSIALKGLGPGGLPTDAASGCLIRYAGKLIVLTVSHATAQGVWAVELEYVPGKGTKLYKLGAMSFLGKGNITTKELKPVDFSYKVLPEEIAPIHRLYDQETESMQDPVPKRILETDLSATPTPSGQYGFFGLTRSQLDGPILRAEGRLVMGMKFVGEEDDFYQFRMATPYEDDKDYKGCSGAPILDRDARLVALVVAGCRDNSCIYGIALRKYKVAIDIDCGLL